MGLFSKLKTSFGGDDPDLMTRGQLGRAVVDRVRITGTSVQMGGGVPEQVCEFDLTVYLDDTPPFAAQARKRVPVYAIGEFRPGQTVVAVRVDPVNHAHVGIDLNSQPPEVRIAAGTAQGSAAALLASGTPCEAVIIQFETLGMKNQNNVDLYAFLLTVMPEGAAPYQIQVGNPVPPEALPLLYPGSKVPARFDPNGVKEAVAIDWAAALARAAGASAGAVH
ncbi:MAG TPA: hypothetical protein VME46_14035 [Acidimicrobiales bacterium]|nr:hypothetical protein [Acidimicrobiales bacterium]